MPPRRSWRSPGCAPNWPDFGPAGEYPEGVPDTELQEIVALTLVFVVHLIGAGLLVWALLEQDTRASWRRRFGGGGGRPPEDPPPVAPDPRPSAAVVRPPLPLAASDPSPVRLRGPGRLADGHEPAPRRPDHVPQPARAPR